MDGRKLRDPLGVREYTVFPPVTNLKGSEYGRHFPGLSVSIKRSEHSDVGPHSQGEFEGWTGSSL